MEAAQLDALRTLIWQNTKDGAKGRNKPKSVLDGMMPEKKMEKDDIVFCKSGTDFDKYRNSLLGR